MKALAEKSFAFCAPFLPGWHDVDTHGAAEFQSRYLVKQTLGAREYAQSYWILRETGQHDADKVIARHLLEQMFSALFETGGLVERYSSTLNPSRL